MSTKNAGLSSTQPPVQKSIKMSGSGIYIHVASHCLCVWHWPRYVIAWLQANKNNYKSGASHLRHKNDKTGRMQNQVKMEAKDVRFKILINNSETRLIKKFFRWQFVLVVLKKYTCFKENYLSLKLFWIFSFKFACLTLDPDLDPN